MPQCAAKNCNNWGKYVFPRDPVRKKQWETAIERKATKCARLCAAHFTPDDYLSNSFTGDQNLLKLKKSAIPTIFSVTKIVRDKSHGRLIKNKSVGSTCGREVSEPERSQVEPEKQCSRFKKNVKKLVQKRSHRLSSLAKINKPDIPRECHQDPDDSAPKNVDTPSHSLADIDTATDCPVQLPESEPSSLSTALSKSTQINFTYIYGSIENHKDKDSAIAFYTGFESYARFHFVFSTLSPMAHRLKYKKQVAVAQNISLENQFFMTMMKLRQNTCNFELALYFGTSSSVVSEIFNTWIIFMDQLWQKLNVWTDKEMLLYYMLDCFKHTDIEAISDQKIDEENDPIESCETGEGMIEAVRMKRKNVTLNIPKFFNSKSSKTVGNRKLADQRIHIESLLGLLKSYKILKQDLQKSLVPLASKIFYVCLMCCNFRESLLDVSK